ncbi:hypothetical protein HXX76_005832 [Chlamydomonas incerta]|uniref:Uncharacterized protein n=1 Tax=Chlamydomonas incerta TaxID=51695 RepID=A0A835T1M6_CHLIN|nr:hypothetical protein HXX76_005832 [Chlamydomonas incerta]|eukprot:KAG2437168.1 hypothetical protein HXX76_005832 [Chlamydomonas incerta]
MRSFAARHLFRDCALAVALLLLLLAAAAAGSGVTGSRTRQLRHNSRRALAAAAQQGGNTNSRPQVELAVFGDSLSDTGNTFRAAGVPQADLYYQGRYSNGPVWIDYLSAAVANTTQLTVRNYAYGGATACGGAGAPSATYPFIRDLPAQTAAFLNLSSSAAAAQGGGAGGGGGGGARRRLVPMNWIGNEDVRVGAGGVADEKILVQAAIRAGTDIDQRAVTTLAIAVTGCRIAWAQRLLGGAGEAAWGGGQRGPDRVLVLLPLMRLDLLPEAPDPLKPRVREIVAVLNAVLKGSAAALQQDLAAAATPDDDGGGSRGARLLVLPEATEPLVLSVRPPFNSSGPCFNQPLDALQPVPAAELRPCPNPNDHAFYDQLHPSTRVHEALALREVLPALRQAGLLDKLGVGRPPP